MSQDTVADILNQIMNAKKAGKPEVDIKRYSKLLIKILEIAKKNKYLDFTLDRNKQLKIKILDLIECRTIKPRYNVKIGNIEKYERRFLPSRTVGIMLISTSQGLMTQKEAYDKNIGGSLVAYFY